VSTSPGSIVKYDREINKTIALMAKTNVYLLNDFKRDTDYFKYLDKRYYYRECNKVIREFEHNQLTLFN
jgi:hypothetical protein